MATVYRYRPSLADRLTAIVLALAICALIVLMLIRMGLFVPPAGVVEKLTAISLKPQGTEHSEKAAAAKAPERQERQATVQPKVTPHVQPRPETPVTVPWIQLSRDQFAASDISKLGKPADASNQNSAKSGSTYGPGEGPGGSTLYNVAWYREPTYAELVTYMPHRNIDEGWAEIACRMIEHYHVEDCRELGESPRGSGLARGLRQAAWQFLVKPPRLDGKPLIGTWVRIHYTFKSSGSSAPTSEMPEGGGDAN